MRSWTIYYCQWDFAMSLDQMYDDKCQDDQSLLDDQCDLLTIKDQYKHGEIDLVEYMEKTTKTPEYQILKENHCD